MRQAGHHAFGELHGGAPPAVAHRDCPGCMVLGTRSAWPSLSSRMLGGGTANRQRPQQKERHLCPVSVRTVPGHCQPALRGNNRTGFTPYADGSEVTGRTPSRRVAKLLVTCTGSLALKPSWVLPQAGDFGSKNLASSWHQNGGRKRWNRGKEGCKRN